MFFSFMIAYEANVYRDEKRENKGLHQSDKNFKKVEGYGNDVPDQAGHTRQ